MKEKNPPNNISDEQFIRQLEKVIFWLGREGRRQANESGDWDSYKNGETGLDVDELAADYWANLGHKMLLIQLLVQLSAKHPIPKQVKELFTIPKKGYEKGAHLYIKAFLAERAPKEDWALLAQRAGFKIGTTEYPLPTTYKKDLLKQARIAKIL